jgi:ribosomal protein S11
MIRIDIVIHLFMAVNSYTSTMMFAADTGSDRATSIEDYQNTCAEFITDISKDYKDWVDRYQLHEAENKSRKTSIDNIVKTTNEWIVRYADTIKKVDIVMNDGVSKMAENTAGYPFKFEVLVNNMTRYTFHPIGEVKVNVRATPREGRLARIGNYQKNQLLLINSSSSVDFTVSSESLKGIDILNDYVVIDAKNCQKYDLISATIIVEESNGNSVTESRGYTNLILIS